MRRQLIFAKANKFSGVAGPAPVPIVFLDESAGLDETTTGRIEVSSTFAPWIDPFPQGCPSLLMPEFGDLGQQ
ncbi:MAG: hypothetical protein RKO24_04640, partial [Candidatus Competibacter sp.]|nr:hypothetical protein [Candidatus Competibacter sp.]